MIQDYEYEQLLSLWESNFGDERSYIEQFFAACKERMKMQILRVDSKIVCSCYLLPAFISTENGTEEKVWYLYALSTREEEKGKGYAGQLLKQIEEDYFLVPSKGLEDFYKKRGLRKWLTQETIEVEAKACENVEICIVSAEDIAEEYEKERNENLTMEGYIRWDYEVLQYALNEHEFCGGKILKWSRDGEVVFALVAMGENGEVIVKEITSDPSQWEYFASLAAGFLKAHKAVITEKTVMVSGNMDVTEGQGYFGLTLG